MKKTTLFLCLFSFVFIGEPEVTKVVEVPGKTKDEIFIAARQWMVNSFKDAKEVIQLSDKETGELSGTGVLPFSMQIENMGQKERAMTCNFRISVWVKEGKYKYSFNEFTNVKYEYAYNGKVYLMFNAITKDDTTEENNIAMMGKKKNNENYARAKATILRTLEEIGKSLEEHISKKSVSDF